MTDQVLRVILAGQSLIETPVQPSTSAGVQLATEIGTADMSVTNFEASLHAENGWSLKTRTLHIATPDAMASLRRFGFNTLALANNHAFDLGHPGLAATRAHAQSSGFATAGSGENISAARAPAALTAEGAPIALLSFDLGPQPDIVYAGAARPGINPLRIRNELVLPGYEVARLNVITQTTGYAQRMQRRVAIGYSEAPATETLDFFGLTVRAGVEIAEHRFPDAQDLENALGCVRAAEASGTLTVVSLHHHHWETNWAQSPGWLPTLASTLIDAGAHAVFCHGSPVLQGMALYHGRPIFYGLGNFIFHTHRAARYDELGIDVWRSVIATCDFMADKTLRSVRIRPIRVGRPGEDRASATAIAGPEILETSDAGNVIDNFIARSNLEGGRLSRTAHLCLIEPVGLRPQAYS